MVHPEYGFQAMGSDPAATVSTCFTLFQDNWGLQRDFTMLMLLSCRKEPAYDVKPPVPLKRKTVATTP